MGTRMGKAPGSQESSAVALREGHAMTFRNLASQILDHDLCARCGACVAACPSGYLHIEDDAMPSFAPAGADAIALCGDCDLCTEICPGFDPATPASERQMFGRSRSPDERWTGIRRRTLSVRCVEQRVLQRAASGGAGTALMLAALRGGLVGGVVVIGRDEQRPWVPKAVVTDCEDTVVECAQSTYCIAPNLQRLADAPWDRLGLTCMPCEAQALRKMQVHGVPAAQRARFSVELACASSTRIAGTEHLIKNRLDVALEEVDDVRYRDGPYPGEFVVRTNDARTHRLPFWELVEEFKSFKTHRCQACPDWWSGVADVSICDGDPNIFKTSREGGQRAKTSTVVSRTEEGDRLIDTACELDLLEAEPTEFVAEESLGLMRKRNRYTTKLRDSDKPVPRAPAADADELETLSDEELIERMSAPSTRPGEQA